MNKKLGESTREEILKVLHFYQQKQEADNAMRLSLHIHMDK